MAAPSYTWDPVVGRFRSRGRFVPVATVRAELDRYLADFERETRRLADDLRAGRTSLEAWRLAMKDQIKAVHLNAARLARGGRDQMDARANGRVGQIIRREYEYLERWVEDIKAGRAPLDGRLASRARQYMDAGRGTFHKVQAEEMVKRGMDLEKSVLHALADHCSQCTGEAAAGFRPIGEMIPIGSRTCLRNCKCSVAYSRAG